MENVRRIRSARETLDFCIAVLSVLLLAYAITFAIEKMADLVALRNVIDSLINDICTHDVADKPQPVISCRVT
jgi:hypothetical protein